MFRLLCLLATLLLVGLHAPGCSTTGPVEASGGNAPRPSAEEDRAFEQRKIALLDGVVRAHQTERPRGKFAYWYAQALFATGRTQDALETIDATLQTPLDDHQGDVFVPWAMADTYVRWQHLLPEATKTQFKDQLTGYAGYDAGKTENHRLMLATARYLAAETWPEAAFGSDFRQQEPTGRNYLLKRMDRYVHRGTVEFDSPAYHAHYIGTMRSLADLAQDEELRRQAALTAEWLILENAGEWLDGHWLSASLRHKSYYDGQADFLAGDYLLWFYFGASVTPDFATEKAVFAVQAAASDARLPAGLTAAATDRSRPFVHRETDVWAGRHYYGTTYLHDAYGLYSVMEDHKVEKAQSTQYHRWAVQWRSDEAKSTLYVKHPHAVTGEEGTTGYEQVMQHRGTLLAVYAIPPTHPKGFVRLRTPSGFEAVIDESRRGDLFLHYGSVLIAVRMSEPFAWDLESDRHDHPARVLGVVVETAHPSAYPGSAMDQLLAFKQATRQRALAFSIADGTPTLGYTTGQDEALSITYNGPRQINGEPMDMSTWPLLENPWMRQTLGENRLVVTLDAHPVVYDFGSWTKP